MHTTARTAYTPDIIHVADAALSRCGTYGCVTSYHSPRYLHEGHGHHQHRKCQQHRSLAAGDLQDEERARVVALQQNRERP